LAVTVGEYGPHLLKPCHAGESIEYATTLLDLATTDIDDSDLAFCRLSSLPTYRSRTRVCPGRRESGETNRGASREN